MNTSSMNIANIKEKIEKEINHPYLKKFMGNPIIDESKLMVLTSLIGNHQSSSIAEKERYIITTMLVQIALDTHEQVPIEFKPNISNEKKEKIQLRVLAGDYYSGLYYLLLSEIDEFDFTHTLATAIKKINEYKMKLYYLEHTFHDEYINIVRNIEVLLIQHVADFVKDKSLNLLSGEWLVMNKLIQEKKNIHTQKKSIILDKWLSHNCNYSSFIDHADRIIQGKTDGMKEILQGLPEQHTFLKNYITDKLSGKFYLKNSIVEEG